MFQNGEVTFYNDGWKLSFELYKFDLNDIQEIHDHIFKHDYGKINWNELELDDNFYYANGLKSVRVVRKSDVIKSIWFGK